MCVSSVSKLCVGGKDGTVTTLESNTAISTELLSEIKKWYTEGATNDDVIERLRLRTVPPGYPIHSWIEGIVKNVSDTYIVT